MSVLGLPETPFALTDSTKLSDIYLQSTGNPFDDPSGFPFTPLRITSNLLCPRDNTLFSCKTFLHQPSSLHSTYMEYFTHQIDSSKSPSYTFHNEPKNDDECHFILSLFHFCLFVLTSCISLALDGQNFYGSERSTVYYDCNSLPKIRF